MLIKVYMIFRLCRYSKGFNYDYNGLCILKNMRIGQGNIEFNFLNSEVTNNGF